MADFFLFISEQWLLVGILLLLIYSFVWREGRKGGTTLSQHQATRMVNNDEAVIVDLREAKEFNKGHIPGAINIPFAKLSQHIGELEPHRDKTIILVDKLGQQTGGAGQTLNAAGFTPARLKGGMVEWQNSSLPVATD